MTKQDLIELVAKEAKLTNKASAERAIDSVFNNILSTLKNEGKMTVSGFGTFKLKKTKSRKGRNPKTGDTIQIPAGKKISFKMSSTLKGNL